MAPGWYPPEEFVTQSYGFCFTGDGPGTLVLWDQERWNLPGGQVEPGERPAETLARIAEEACARVIRARFLAYQHVWDPEAPDARTSHPQTRGWARVELDLWDPRHEIVARRLVTPALVAPSLFWQSKAAAERLLGYALAVEQADRSSGVT